MSQTAGNLPRINTPEAFQAAFDVSRESLDRLRLYAEILDTWQRKINLVAPGTLPEVWHRHFADSAQLFPLAPVSAERWLDLGSGAGFPGMVLAILRAGRGAPEDKFPLRLIESDARKSAFLGEIARRTGVAVDITVARIELSSTQSNFGPVNVITARALAPLPRLLGYAHPYFGAGTTGIFPKGRDVEREIDEARAAFEFDARLVASRTDPEGRIVVISNLAAKGKGDTRDRR